MNILKNGELVKARPVLGNVHVGQLNPGWYFYIKKPTPRFGGFSGTVRCEGHDGGIWGYDAGGRIYRPEYVLSSLCPDENNEMSTDKIRLLNANGGFRITSEDLSFLDLVEVCVPEELKYSIGDFEIGDFVGNNEIKLGEWYYVDKGDVPGNFAGVGMAYDIRTESTEVWVRLFKVIEDNDNSSYSYYKLDRTVPPFRKERLRFVTLKVKPVVPRPIQGLVKKTEEELERERAEILEAYELI